MTLLAFTKLAFPKNVLNLEHLSKEAFLEGFRIALDVLVGIMLLALLLASFTPKVETEKVTAEKAKEIAADISNKRL